MSSVWAISRATERILGSNQRHLKAKIRGYNFAEDNFLGFLHLRGRYSDASCASIMALIESHVELLEIIRKGILMVGQDSENWLAISAFLHL